MGFLRISKYRQLLVLVSLSVILALPSIAHASPFGAGVYGADVPYGSATSISISLGSAASMTLTPSGPNFSGSGSQTVTITSTDVVGYKLYVNADTTTSMSNGTDTIAASANGSPAPLAVNSWGYNTSGSSSNFKGMSLSQTLVTSKTGPFKNGDSTTFTYGSLIDITKSSGSYTVGVVYTAIGDS